MGSRLELQAKLEELLGSNNVYYQPPESKKISYDCIVYKKSDIWHRHADNKNYTSMDEYELTLIYKNPDRPIAKEILEAFPYSRFQRHFTSDNLNHDVMNIYY